MLNAARAARRFAAGGSYEEFLLDEMRQAAVLHKLTVLGEAAKRVTPALRQTLPAIPWRSATGLRDRVVHEYQRIALDVVWRVVSDDLPPLVDALETLNLESPE